MIRQNSLQLQLLFLAFSFFSSASSFGQTSPSWIHCANENQQCSFSGMAQVRYGASGKYFTGSYKSNVSCSNSVFGDPLVGLLKSCDYQIIPSIQFCANENQSCSFSGIKTLRYGANGVYYSKQFSGGVKCSNAVFGDPISGVFKHCDIVNDLIASTAPTPIAVRNPLQQPFASTSIWNMPIGSAAVYVPANMPTIPNNDSWAPMPMVDEEHIVLKAAAPLTNINFSSAGWSAASRCNQTGGLLAQVPIPTNYVVANDNANSSSAFLLADGRSIIQTQPFARCSAGGSATSLVKFASVDLYGDGMAGAHGGSGLSAIGGSLRIGEMRPGQKGPPHALKMIVYARQSLYPCTTSSQCYRWPATNADSYAIGFYGSQQSPINAAMKMGALLAIPASNNLSSIGFETEPGRQLAWTLQNYGAYIVDDGYGAQVGFATENGPDGSFIKQFQADYGFSFPQRVIDNTPFMRDVQRLMKALNVVDNNGPSSIGGGGTPLQPLAPAIAP